MASEKLTQKALQVANLSPPVEHSFINNLENVHPMRQVAIMSVVQVAVFGVMLLAFWIINLFVGH